MKNNSNEREMNDQCLSWLQMITSVFAATFGVQSQKNKERDFTYGDIKKFIVVALGFTLFLLLGLIGLVQLVL